MKPKKERVKALHRAGQPRVARFPFAPIFFADGVTFLYVFLRFLEIFFCDLLKISSFSGQSARIGANFTTRFDIKRPVVPGQFGGCVRTLFCTFFKVFLCKSYTFFNTVFP